MKALLRRLVPRRLYQRYVRLRVTRQRRRNEGRSLREIFSDIYERHAWGGEGEAYCSGSGSTERHAARYADAVGRFVRDRGIRTIVDLGCGDFVVGRRLISPDVSYIGVDLVEELIRRNRERHGAPGVSFACLDITSDPLPDGDLCLVRQVLQHLSNDQIGAVLRNVRKYPFVLITEHYPAPGVNAVPNKDKPHGADTRIYDDSAVYLDRPPFSLAGVALFLEDDALSDLMNRGEKIRTYLVDNRRA